MKIMVPNAFYVTFNNEVALHEAIKKEKFYYKDEEIRVSRAHEPSNIIWENRDSHVGQKMRNLFAILIMFVIAGLFFVGAVVGMQIQLGYTYLRKPPGLECNKVLELHGDDIYNMAA